MNIVLYSTGCPRCQVLKNKLEDKGIPFSVVTDVDRMTDLGIQSIPVLSVDGEMMEFVAANAWINLLPSGR